MKGKVIGESAVRWDAKAKVTGKAKFTEDFPVRNLLHGKIVRSTIAHGKVLSYDTSEAEKIDGVIKILLPEDVPQNKYPTAGHPWSLDPAKGDIQDRTLLTRNVRQYGDEIAAVVAENYMIAEKAAAAIKVIYEEYPVYLTPEESMAEGARRIHEERDNIIADTKAGFGDVDKGIEEADHVFEDSFSTQVQQHSHMENQAAVAYQDVDDRWVCTSSTQIPHICRRVIGQALGINWSKVRVKKPFIGGGFGNKQEVTVEPMSVAMSMACGGRPVKLILTREESLAFTRTRHAISYKMRMGVTKDGRITTIDCDAISNQGAYASHGHSIGGKGGGFINALYHLENIRYTAKTVYTNIGVAGAMRGYGIPQVMFALESFIDDAAKELGFDPIEFRQKNLVPEGTVNKITGVNQNSNKLSECYEKGSELFDWEGKEHSCDDFNAQFGDKLRGIGVAGFAYGSGTYPYGLEVAGARLILIQDGSCKLMVGATEIGQGSDTVFTQMAAETLGVTYDKIITDAETDTDIAPFDTGSYASRQSYISGSAVKKAAEDLKCKILDLAQNVYYVKTDNLDLVENNIVQKDSGKVLTSLADLSMISFYDLNLACALVGEGMVNVQDNSYAYGASFIELEVDMKTGEIEILSALNVHDSGTILNPLLAEGQVEGGMGMAIGYALNEELRYSAAGVPLNNNLLDYKMLTTMDMPSLNAAFVESADPVGPYGNKSLGENPHCSPAPAIRNAVLYATGIKINHLPLASQRVFEHLKTADLI